MAPSGWRAAATAAGAAASAMLGGDTSRGNASTKRGVGCLSAEMNLRWLRPSGQASTGRGAQNCHGGAG
eukprot:8250553-Pyramimonas_sp.AAC.1